MGIEAPDSIYSLLPPVLPALPVVHLHLRTGPGGFVQAVAGMCLPGTDGGQLARPRGLAWEEGTSL